jgi:DHA1 family tetracycline resistance protein-like MFS transporter
MIPYCLGGISGPALQGFATNKVAKNEQGELQGAITIINSLSVIIGPAIFSFLFSHYTNKQSGLYFPGAPFLLAAVLMVISTFLAIRSFINPTKKAKSIQTTNPT